MRYSSFINLPRAMSLVLQIATHAIRSAIQIFTFYDNSTQGWIGLDSASPWRRPFASHHALWWRKKRAH